MTTPLPPFDIEDSNRPLYYVNESGLKINALTGNLLKETDNTKEEDIINGSALC